MSTFIPRFNKPFGVSAAACNYHLDCFGQLWDLRDADGVVAHTACVGFGLERLALALLRHHCLSPAHRPSRVAEALWPAGGRA